MAIPMKTLDLHYSMLMIKNYRYAKLSLALFGFVTQSYVMSVCVGG